MTMLTATERINALIKIFGQGNLSGNSKNIEVWCPFCSDKNKSKRKLSIEIAHGFFNCWVCGQKGRHIATIVRKFFSRDDQIDLLKIYPRVSTKLEITDVRPPPKLPADFKLLATATGHHPDLKACKRYILETRGLTEEDLWYFKLGYSGEFEWTRRVIMPSFDAEGRLNYFTGRSVDPDVTLRYNTAEADRTQVIFNEINVNWSKRLVLCEGPFDSVKCGQNVVPLLGNSLNENSALFCNIVMHGTPIALALDSDMRKRTLELVRKLEQYMIDVVVVDLGKYKDPGDMTKVKFQAALKCAKPLQWDDIFLEKLARASKVSMRI